MHSQKRLTPATGKPFPIPFLMHGFPYLPGKTKWNLPPIPSREIPELIHSTIMWRKEKLCSRRSVTWKATPLFPLQIKGYYFWPPLLSSINSDGQRNGHIEPVEICAVG